jgi:holin-like protein
VTQRLVHCAQCLGQLGLLWGISLAGRFLAEALALPVPGNVLGVLLLFGLLCLGVVKLEQVARTADFLLRHLVFFFIPIAVGLMDWGATFAQYGLMLLLAVVISSVLPFFAVSYLTLLLQRRR